METLEKRLNLIKLEENILDFWKKEEIYSKIREKENLGLKEIPKESTKKLKSI